MRLGTGKALTQFAKYLLALAEITLLLLRRNDHVAGLVINASNAFV
jgi:hypothetical protein